MKKYILLPTTKPTNLALFYPNSKLVMDKKGFTSNSICSPQHLYEISDEEIKEGDLVYNQFAFSIENQLVKITNNIVAYNAKQHGWKKIIATTDISLKISMIDDSMVKYYCDTHNTYKV